MRLTITLSLLLSYTNSAYAQEDWRDFTVLQLTSSQIVSNVPQIPLDASDRRWLQHKKVLILGTSLSATAPLELSANQRDFEGVTADYAQLIARALNVEVQVRSYESRTQALAALKLGDLDLLGAAGDTEAADPQLLITQPYLNDPAVIVTRNIDNLKLPLRLDGVRLAMFDHYTQPSLVKAHYPNAHVKLYPTVLDALSAVELGQAEAYIGGAMTSNYLITRNFLLNTHILDFAGLETSGVSFAVRTADTRLVHLLDQVLAAVPDTQKLTIAHRWGRGSIVMHPRSSLDLTPKEQSWVTAHPQLTVAVPENTPPFSFFDQNQRFRGINADMLDIIAHRTGLQFNTVRSPSRNDAMTLVQTGKVDLVADFSDNAGTEKSLRFSGPYLTTPLVLISRNELGQPHNLNEMGGKRLAISGHGNLPVYLSQHFPQITLVPADSAAEAMAWLADGKVEANIDTLVSARYLLAKDYQDRLCLCSVISSHTVQLGLVTATSAQELYSILDKALISLSPEELNELANRWRDQVVVSDRHGRARQLAILQGLTAAIALLLLAISWIAYLRHLMRKHQAAEQALNEQMEFLRVLIDGLPHPIYVRDRQARLLLCNQRYLEAMGVSREQVVGKCLSEGLSGEFATNQDLEQQYREVMYEGKELFQDRNFKLANGESIVAYHWIRPFRDRGGNVKGIIAGWIDVSERERLHEQLREAKQEADKANRAKTTFLAGMSHEIRTPMNAVVGMLELAMKRAEQGILDRVAIEVASGAARGLLDLIGDILDIVRIESGRLTLTPIRASLKELVESVVRVFDGLARQKQLDLVLQFDEQANREVLIDPLRLKQVLSNLLSNAIKFTHQGYVLIGVHVRSAPDDHLDLRLWVRDTGVGITPEDQQRLFAPFTQVDSSTGGSGLGLIISRTLCTMMGGELTLSSVPNLGTHTEVTLTLPLLPPLPAQAADPGTATLTKSLNVLVVDDYPANRLLLGQQLNYLGHRAAEAQDGAHGLRSWRGQRFDVVISDCNMPTMSGYELARAIRAEEAAAGLEPCLILGFTANAQPEERERCQAAGMDDCMFKPISMRELAARLSRATTVFASADDSLAEDGVDQVIDLSSLEQLTQGNPASVVSLLQDLLSSNEQDMQHLLKLFSQNDYGGLADLAHRIKGGARIVGAKRLVRCCEHLQGDCQLLDLERLTESVDALHQAMEELTRTLLENLPPTPS